MRKVNMTSVFLLALLFLSLVFNYYQWNKIKSNETQRQAFMARQLGHLGSDFITANGALHSILTDQPDKNFAYGRGFEALMNASEIASELAIPRHGKHHLTWHKMYVSLQNSAIIFNQLSSKDKLGENEKSQLNNINKLVDAYFEVMKQANHNTGYIDDLSMRKADEAAEHFFQTMKSS